MKLTLAPFNLSSQSMSLVAAWFVVLNLEHMMSNAAPLALGYTVIQNTTSTLPLSQTAAYTCVLRNNWNAANHPRLYPGASAHWTPPVLATHNAAYRMWAPGTLASPGVELLAETGRVSTLRTELQAAVPNTGNFVIGEDLYFDTTQQPPTETFTSLVADASHPLLSAITMVGPSPDWITGFYNFPLHNPNTRTWRSRFVINTFPFDAGTETGSTFTLNNADQNPHVPIRQFTPATPLVNTGVFLSSDRTKVVYVAQWECILTNQRAAAGGTSGGATNGGGMGGGMGGGNGVGVMNNANQPGNRRGLIRGARDE